MANWGAAGEGALGGAATGAEIGSIVPGIGTAIGAGVGGLIGGAAGLFSNSSGDSLGNPPNPYSGLEQGVINEELNSHVGKDTAAHTAGMIENEANKAQADLASNPRFSSNASVQAANANQIQRTAENSMIGANLKGAEMDQTARQAGLAAAQKQNAFDWDTWKAQQDYLHQPSALSTIFAQSLGSFAGGAGAAASRKLFGMGDNANGTNGVAGGDQSGNYLDTSAFQNILGASGTR
ncbi:hypothetical protein KGP36_01695 [Patescibacteria group bacterium]|nr:hypothetical protein [Patescibacteria group bacterium]